MCQVSVVIVNWNVRDLVSACLRSVLAESAEVDLEVIVIDNNSADGSQEAIKSEFPQVHLVENESNLGFAAGCNQGIAIARGKYVLMLNPDTEVLDGAVHKTVELMNQHPDWGILGCQVLKTETEIQRTCFSFPGPLNQFLIATYLHRIFPRSRFFGRPEMSWWDRRSELDVDVVTGMFMLVRSDAIEAVGSMDDDYFVYGEEADWCFRFRRAGWRCVFSPVAQILHVDGGGRSTSQIAVKMFVQLHKSLLMFNRKNLGWWASLSARAILLASMSARSLIWMIVSLWRGERARVRARCSFAAALFHLTGWEPRHAPGA